MHEKLVLVIMLSAGEQIKATGKMPHMSLYEFKPKKKTSRPHSFHRKTSTPHTKRGTNLHSHWRDGAPNWSPPIPPDLSPSITQERVFQEAIASGDDVGK